MVCYDRVTAIMCCDRNMAMLCCGRAMVCHDRVRAWCDTVGLWAIIPGSEILPHMYNSNELGTKTDIPRVDTASQGMELQYYGKYFV